MTAIHATQLRRSPKGVSVRKGLRPARPVRYTRARNRRMAGMDESALIDWYDVVEGVANGRMTGHVCPMCHASQVNAEVDGRTVRARCGACNAYVEGRLKHGRDDAYDAGDRELPLRRHGKRDPAPHDIGLRRIPLRKNAKPVAKAPTAKAPAERVDWEWKLPAGAGSVEGMSIWMDIITAIHNGRLSNHRCP
ncbi:MAG: hypothetical protein ACI9U2_004918, partial [Bradymonadia bacterium]